MPCDTRVSHLFIYTEETLEDILLKKEPKLLVAHKREKCNIFKTVRNTKQRVPVYRVEYCPVYPVKYPPVYTVKEWSPCLFTRYSDIQFTKWNTIQFGEKHHPVYTMENWPVYIVKHLLVYVRYWNTAVNQG